MLSNIKAIVPENLIFLAKKTPNMPVAIVCAHHKSSMNSAKQACELGLIDPIFIGKKELIQKEADNLNWNINNYKIYSNYTISIIITYPISIQYQQL